MRPEIERMHAAGFDALQRGDAAAAARCFRGILAAQPADHAAWNGLAWASLRGGDAAAALAHAKRAHELARSNPDYLNTLGVALGENAEFAAAEDAFRKALRARPMHVDAIVNLAKTLEKGERFADAAPLYERVLALAPQMPRLATNLALVYRQLGDAARARRVLQQAPADEAQAMGLADCDFEEGRVAEGLERLAAAAAHPGWMLARLSRAYALLGAGLWREAWEGYRWRHLAAPADAGRRLAARLDGRRVRLKNEQGLGDVLFFLRFVPALRARGASVSLDCPQKLKPLLAGSGLLEGDAVDEEILLADLPALLGAEDAPPAWPVAVDEAGRAAARGRLAALGPAPYLAVTWRAGTDVARGREFGAERTALAKAVPPAALGAALRGWKGTVLLLQRGARAGEAGAFAGALQAPAHDLSALGDDLPALAGVLAVVDDYATVSNTNVHILAGLGRTARVLVPRPPEWRWMHEGDSPWFPGFAIYRQPASRDWSAPLASLRKDLLG